MLAANNTLRAGTHRPSRALQHRDEKRVLCRTALAWTTPETYERVDAWSTSVRRYDHAFAVLCRINCNPLLVCGGPALTVAGRPAGAANPTRSRINDDSSKL